MSSAFRMIDVGSKPVTGRRAVARGEIQLSEKVRRAIEEKTVPKGDVLTLAEVAGICAAKRTSDLLPLCHPLILDAVQLHGQVDRDRNRVLIRCEVSSQGRTGVEMEALSGVSAALLCVYDLTKGLDKGAVISGILLEHKEGGKSGSWDHPDFSPPTVAGSPPPESRKELHGLRAAVMTVSDRCYRRESTDQSGALLAAYLTDHGAELCGTALVPDDVQTIRKQVGDLVRDRQLDILLVTGGTGLGPRDVTPEAFQPLWSRNLSGFGELFRNRGLRNTPRAWLSRAEAGLIDKTLAVLLPGSPSGVRDGLDLLDGMIPHMILMVRGGKH